LVRPTERTFEFRSGRRSLKIAEDGRLVEIEGRQFDITGDKRTIIVGANGVPTVRNVRVDPVLRNFLPLRFDVVENPEEQNESNQRQEFDAQKVLEVLGDDIGGQSTQDARRQENGGRSTQEDFREGLPGQWEKRPGIEIASVCIGPLSVGSLRHRLGIVITELEWGRPGQRFELGTFGPDVAKGKYRLTQRGVTVIFENILFERIGLGGWSDQRLSAISNHPVYLYGRQTGLCGTPFTGPRVLLWNYQDGMLRLRVPGNRSGETAGIVRVVDKGSRLQVATSPALGVLGDLIWQSYDLRGEKKIIRVNRQGIPRLVTDKPHEADAVGASVTDSRTNDVRTCDGSTVPVRTLSQAKGCSRMFGCLERSWRRTITVPAGSCHTHASESPNSAGS
jgi:hypothetical protein